MGPDHQVSLTAQGPYDAHATLRWLPLGHRDPTWHRGPEGWVHAVRTPAGPATARFIARRGGVDVQLWGPGTDWVAPRLGAWSGVDDAREGFAPDHPWVAEAWRAHDHARLPRVVDGVQALCKVVLQQRVTYADAHRAWFGMCRAWGEPAPGPFGLLLPPDPRVLARQPYEALHPLGVERKRALTLKEVGLYADRIWAWCDDTPEVARGALAKLKGIGPWTLGMLLGAHLGDADAVPVRDVHLPHTVSWALQRRPRSDDAEMLRLLAPFRPHRARVIRLLLQTGIRAPKRGAKRRGGFVEGS